MSRRNTLIVVAVLLLALTLPAHAREITLLDHDGTPVAYIDTDEESDHGLSGIERVTLSASSQGP